MAYRAVVAPRSWKGPPAAGVATAPELRRARWPADSGCVNSSLTRTRTIAVQTTPTLAELSSTELAELVALERLALGAVHALNNAFTTVLGEASFLESKRKGDPELEEACQVIRAEIDRCARLTRALLSRRSPPVAATIEAPDLGRIVRDLSGLLAATLSSRLMLRVETGGELLLVKGCASAIELLVILMVHQAAAFAPAPAELRLCAMDDEERGRHGVSVELRSPDLAPESARGSRPAAQDRAAALAALALHHLASEQGAEIESVRTRNTLTLRLFLPAFQGEALSPA
jgi:signal transduction histidine kinase